MTFDILVKKVLKHEGGYVNDPSDPGGETKYGISKRAFPDLDIKNLTEEQAILIYYDEYWLDAKVDKYAPMLTKVSTFKAKNFPSVSKANFTEVTWSLP